MRRIADRWATQWLVAGLTLVGVLAMCRAQNIDLRSPGLDVIANEFEQEVFAASPSPERRAATAIAIEEEAHRRAMAGEPGFSRLYRLACTAYSRCGESAEAIRVCEIVVSKPESTLEGALACRMLGTLLASEGDWAAAEATFMRSLATLELAGVEDGRLRYPSIRGLAGAMRAQGQYSEAIQVQQSFLDTYSLSLGEIEQRSLLLCLAKDSAMARQWAASQRWAALLFAQFPGWGLKDGTRVLLHLDLLAQGDRDGRRGDPEYLDRLTELWSAEEVRSSPACLLIGDEIANCLVARGGESEKMESVYRSIVERVIVDEAKWTGFRTARDGVTRASRFALQRALGSRFSELATTSASAEQQDEMLQICALLVDYFPGSPLAEKANDRLRTMTSEK